MRTAESKNKNLSVLAPFVLAATAFVFGAGCSQGTGPDAISSRGPFPSGDISTYACADCHLSPDNPGLNPLATNGSGTDGKHAAHYGTWGIDCEKCHLGYTGAGTHFNGNFDTGNPSVALVIFDATNPSGLWISDTGPQTGQCSTMDCHGTATLDWYGTGGWSLPACVACHLSVRGTRRQVMGAGGDFGANASLLSHHVDGAADPTDAQCTACHDQSQHMAGTVRLLEADTSAVITYDPASPAGLEPFCLSCHDGDGAGGDMSPFADGQTLGVAPYRMSAEIKTHWNKAYGHQRLSPGLSCMGSGAPDTGCHAGGHGSANAAILARNMTLPNNNGGPYEVGDEVHYEICFNCHQNYPRVTKEAILGVQAGGNYDWDHYWWGILPPYSLPNIITIFRDRNANGPNFYDDTNFMGSHLNLHFWHLEDTLFRYRDFYDWTGITCITCHNVHGSDTQWGWVYDEMQLVHYTVGSDEYGVMEYVDVNTLDNYPFGCNWNCHSVLGQTHMWFEPPDE